MGLGSETSTGMPSMHAEQMVGGALDIYALQAGQRAWVVCVFIVRFIVKSDQWAFVWISALASLIASLSALFDALGQDSQRLMSFRKISNISVR